MSRFGSTGSFYYASGDTLTAGTTVTLTSDSMPNYPFETFTDTDRVIHRTKTGRKYSYQNFSLQGYGFNFSNLKESMRGSLRTMYNARPIFTWSTNGSTWGTFRFAEDTWEDQETAFELYDVRFTIVEDA